MYRFHKLYWQTIVLGYLTLTISSPSWAQKHHHEHPMPQHGAAHEHHFDDIDKAVKMFEYPERDTWQKPEEVVKQVQLRTGDVVVDIGAGTGYFTRRFAAVVGPNGKATGLDIEASMVGYMTEDAKKHGLTQYSARKVLPNDPQLASQSVDVVFICDTYHHMQDRVAYLRLLAQALKPKGRVIIVDFQKRETPLGPPMKWRLTPDTVSEEFRQAGFQSGRSLDFLPYQYFLEFTVTDKK